jgi:long-chain fatty acid transport protein
MNNPKRLLAMAVSAALAAPMAAQATNGMNMESYGPIAGGVGGASMAYDNGTAAMMNNPATLGLAEDGNRLDVALGHLGIDITVDGPSGSGMSWDSDATGYYMPAMGWVQNSGKLAYGVGVFAQGGMGTEYSGTTTPGGAMSAPQAAANIAYLDSFVGAPGINAHISMDQAMMGTTTNSDYANAIAAEVQGIDEKSEVSVGRLIFPFAYDLNEKVELGASIDYVWAGMDLQMAMNGAMMAEMMPGGTQTSGTITGGMINAMGSMFFDPSANNFDGSLAAPTMNDFGVSGLNYGYFDFTDGTPYKGEAKGTGFAGKIGATFKVNPQLTVGATYHSETAMSDLEADHANIKMSTLMTTLDTSTGTMITMPADVVMKGKIKVKDFQWPATMALGMAFQANDKLMLAADVKRINWSDVMSDFTMQFTADSIVMGGNDVTAMFPQKDMTATLYQDWDDQTVVQLGAAYQATPELAVRAGYNQASNPVPEDTVHYLFPAIIEQHYTAGVGYTISSASSVDFSLSYAPEVTVDMGDSSAEISHSQTNWQLMYSYKF